MFHMVGEEQTITGLIPYGIMGGDILDTIYKWRNVSASLKWPCYLNPQELLKIHKCRLGARIFLFRSSSCLEEGVKSFSLTLSVALVKPAGVCLRQQLFLSEFYLHVTCFSLPSPHSAVFLHATFQLPASYTSQEVTALIQEIKWALTFTVYLLKAISCCLNPASIHANPHWQYNFGLSPFFSLSHPPKNP